jgi:hypothetical protein
MSTETDLDLTITEFDSTEAPIAWFLALLLLL